MNKRDWTRTLLATSLAFTLYLAWWVSQRSGPEANAIGVVEAVKPGRPRDSAPRPSQTELGSETAIQMERLDRRRLDPGTTDPFKVTSWFVPPPPPPPTPVVVEKPRPPALPFQYMGKFREADSAKEVFYLTKGEDSFAVGIGDKLDERYRVDGIASGQLVIVYLPLNEKQYLPIGYEP